MCSATVPAPSPARTSASEDAREAAVAVDDEQARDAEALALRARLLQVASGATGAVGDRRIGSG